MYLKRLYERDDEGGLKLDDAGKANVIGVRVLRSGPRQHFSPNLVQKGAAAGWLSMQDGKIIIHGEGGDLSYSIERIPGYYCCHCGDPLDDSKTSQNHVASEHEDEESPDKENPSGYERINYYDCAKEA